MTSLVDLQKKLAERERKYFENPKKYVKKLKEIVREKIDPYAKVYIFGSAVRGDFILGKSDIDVLVVSDKVPKRLRERSIISVEFLKSINDIYAPFEVHFATKEEFEGWYKRFIKDDIEEV